MYTNLMIQIQCHIFPPSSHLFPVHFFFMNIAHLISKTKQKLKFLADICDANTYSISMFCETFLHYGIGEIEIQIPDLSITRCDRLSRVGVVFVFT